MLKLSSALILALVLAPAIALPAVESPQEARELIAQRHLDSAEKIIVSALVATPRDPEWITLLAEVRLDQGRVAESLALLDDANKIGGVTAVRAQLAGLAESAAGQLDLAEPHFRTAIRLDPGFAAAHYFLARLLYTRNRFDAAIQESKNAIALSPGMVRAYENVGLCYEGKEDYKEAERWYLEAIRQDEAAGNKTEWPLLDLGTMLIHNNRLAEAKQYLTQAIAINPGNAQSLLEMGILLDKTGDPKSALRSFQDAIQFDPHLAAAYYHAARMCQKLHEQDQAQLYFAKFKQATDEKQ